MLKAKCLLVAFSYLYSHEKICDIPHLIMQTIFVHLQYYFF
jgi:hypothetical protein